MTLGQKVVAARKALGWRTADLARIAGLPRTTVVQIEADQQEQKNLRLTTVVALLDALTPHLELGDFLDGMALNRIDRFVVKLRRRAA